jgi:hypothetical protein
MVKWDRRRWMTGSIASAISTGLLGHSRQLLANPRRLEPAWEQGIRAGLDYLAKTQSTSGQWRVQP